MFSILRFRQGCLYFHFYCNVWVSLVLLQGLLSSALGVPSSPGSRGDSAGKKLHNTISLHLAQMCPFAKWQESTVSPIAPFISTLRSLEGGGKKSKNPRKGLCWKKYCSPGSLSAQKHLLGGLDTVEGEELIPPLPVSPPGPQHCAGLTPVWVKVVSTRVQAGKTGFMKLGALLLPSCHS